MKTNILIFAILLTTLTTCQIISLTLQAPAHVFRVQSYAGGAIRASLTWYANYDPNVYLSPCLLKGGQSLNSYNCRGIITRVGLHQLALSYDVPTTDVYFIRIDCTAPPPWTIIKYDLTYTSSNPDRSYTYTMGHDINNPSKLHRFFNGQISNQKYMRIDVKNRLGSGQFGSYDAIQFGAGYIFSSVLQSPSHYISYFTQLTNEQKCLIDVSAQAGVWLLTLELGATPFGLLFDVAVLIADIGNNEDCQAAAKNGVNVGMIIGAVVGGIAGCFFLMFCLAMFISFCRRSSYSY